MKHATFLLLAVFILAINVACSDVQAAEIAPVANNTAVSVAETQAVENRESYPEPIQVMDETAAGIDSAETGDEITRPAGWNDETHSKSVDANYEVVFPEDEVNTMTITIDPEDWQAMLGDMTALYGEQGSGGGMRGGMPGGGQRGEAPPMDFNIEEILPEGCELPDGFVPGPFAEWPEGCEPDFGGMGGPGGRPQAPGTGDPGTGGPGGPPPAPDMAAPGTGDQGVGGGPGMGGPGMGDAATENPIWVAADIEFEGDIWTDVGVRFKGNSSLKSTWSSGSLELPVKLDFDQFEDENPAIDDQRFYGFKQLSLSNNFNDTTYMRDTVASDIFEESGIASAETAFYELYVDYGEGPVSFGLYTMIEVIDDTVIERVFGDDDGNIYEADGTAASLTEGTLDGISSSFQKENNEEEADWSDIETLYTILHSDTRQSDPNVWKTDLELIFDVDTFLHWLAINTVIENWDTYGAMTHNFYLYNNPETGLLTWIPWDHNEALQEGKRSSMTLDMELIGAEWPLISYLLADEEYYATYVGYVDETVNTAFVAEEMVDKYQEIVALIEPFAAEEIGAETFAQSVQALINHTYNQAAEAEQFLSREAQ